MENICGICLNSVKTFTEIVCDHKFCNNCITKWLEINNSCPICRIDIDINSIHSDYIIR